jgi:hypothetical protein
MQGLVEKPEGKRPLRRTRRRWADNFAMDYQEVGWVVDRIGLTRTWNRCR